MTTKNFLSDLWLTVRYGKWKVTRSRVYGHRGIAGVGWFWRYQAECRRTGDVIHCNSRRIAEGACATENDLRGEASQ